MSMRKLRILLLRLWGVPLVFLVVCVRPRWSVGSVTEVVVELGGYFFLLAGLALRAWSILYIGGRKSSRLVTDGPYSICRNPLYVGTFLAVIGASMCLENFALLLAALVVFLPIHWLVTRLEEEHLESKFPGQYAEYRKRVPRFWPRLRNYRAREQLLVSMPVIRRMMVDAACVLLIPKLEDILDALNQAHVLPVLWYFP